jgi:hypothetical protein
VGFGGAMLADGAAWCGPQASVKHSGVDPAAVADAGQPGGESFGREPVGAVVAVEAVQKCQADRAVDVSEQADCAGEDTAEVFAQLVGQADAVGDEVLAGAAGAAKCELAQGHRQVRTELLDRAAGPAMRIGPKGNGEKGKRTNRAGQAARQPLAARPKYC